MAKKKFVSPTAMICNSENLVFPPLLKIYHKIEKDFFKDTGMMLSVNETWRSFLRQDKLYAQGRENIKHPKVTNAKAGDSLHNYGLAIDVVGDADPIKKGRQRPYDVKWAVLGRIIEDHGLIWGGRWRDLGHMELDAGMGLQEIKTLYKQGGILNVWRNVELHLRNIYPS